MKTILLVDDDATLRYSVEKQLTDAGYNVIPAADSMAALYELSLGSRIDLLLTDIVMPKDKPQGLALARTARMRRSHLPIVFMTGYDDVAGEGVELPGPLFRKPVAMDDLLKAIGNAFEVSAARA